jgi:3-hydroxyisobutyrate dehydrogenase-like beta-hydroxyacid dehydrogenase
MGTPIATLLMKAGYQVTGFDIIKKQMSNLVSSRPQGRQISQRGDKRCRPRDVVPSKLEYGSRRSGRKDGVVEGAQRGQMVLDTSTSSMGAGPWVSWPRKDRVDGCSHFRILCSGPEWEIWSSW